MLEGYQFPVPLHEEAFAETPTHPRCRRGIEVAPAPRSVFKTRAPKNGADWPGCDEIGG